MNEVKEEIMIELRRLQQSESFAREALQACDNFLDYSHAGEGNQRLAYLYVKRLIKEWLDR